MPVLWSDSSTIDGPRPTANRIRALLAIFRGVEGVCVFPLWFLPEGWRGGGGQVFLVNSDAASAVQFCRRRGLFDSPQPKFACFQSSGRPSFDCNRPVSTHFRERMRTFVAMTKRASIGFIESNDLKTQTVCR